MLILFSLTVPHGAQGLLESAVPNLIDRFLGPKVSQAHLAMKEPIGPSVG